MVAAGEGFPRLEELKQQLAAHGERDNFHAIVFVHQRLVGADRAGGTTIVCKPALPRSGLASAAAV